MNETEKTYVIAGASLTGAKAAETLREQGFEGRVVLIGSESERPYERPPLSKDFLRGETDEKPFVHDEDYYKENEIELRLETTVDEISPDSNEVVLDGGERLAYDGLLIATGAEPRRLDLPGADLDGVHTLRTVEDSESLGAAFGDGVRVVVIGAGWIGCEVAASARQKGCEVNIVEAASVPLERVLGSELGGVYADIHTDHGVRFIGDSGVESIGGDGSVESVTLAGGERLDADLVVIGVGVSPRVGLAEKAGLDVDNGILVDAGLHTSVPGIFAAGDVANAEHPFYGERVRVEHWANAGKQGPLAARSMLGEDVAYEEIPYFFSDQYDVGMEYSGLVTAKAEIVFRGDVSGREFIAFWLDDERRVIAGMNVNVWDVNETVQEMIRSRRAADPARLADMDAKLSVDLLG